jgi:glycosyltransferase involved in cell wall biosynthesis
MVTARHDTNTGTGSSREYRYAPADVTKDALGNDRLACCTIRWTLPPLSAAIAPGGGEQRGGRGRSGGMNHPPKYVIVSPVRNEGKHIRNTLESVTRQTVQPAEWVVVDDGSRDDTPDIVREYAKTFPWIRLVERRDRGYAEPGRGVIEAFYAGYERIGHRDFDFIVKLDGDLTFGERYFESLFDRFRENPRLGMASGVCYVEINGGLERENHPEFHVRGPSKVYRRECWEQIGVLVKHLGWDSLDEIKAQYHGWDTRSYKDLVIIHHKVTGKNTGVFRWAIKLGQSDYYCGYHPLFLLAKGLRRLFLPPYVVGGVGILWGYFGNYLRGAERFPEEDVVHFLRNEQLKRLTWRGGIWR